MTGNDTEILQIAATDGADPFEVYILPTRPISLSASSVNKLTFQHGILFYNSRPVRAVPLAEGLSQMISWLKPKAPCLLIAHNCKSFDAKHLIKALESTGVDKKFSAIVSGFSDTLPAFKELLPQRKSYSQENLVRDLLHCSYEAHNATSDVQSLYQLVNKFLNTKLLRKHSFSVSWVKEHNVCLAQRNVLQRTLHPLLNKKVISTGMATKIAKSGLGFHHLQLAFQRGGADGLELVLKEKFNGKVRVTANKRILFNIVNYFTDL